MIPKSQCFIGWFARQNKNETTEWAVHLRIEVGQQTVSQRTKRTKTHWWKSGRKTATPYTMGKRRPSTMTTTLSVRVPCCELIYSYKLARPFNWTIENWLAFFIIPFFWRFVHVRLFPAITSISLSRWNVMKWAAAFVFPSSSSYLIFQNGDSTTCTTATNSAFHHNKNENQTCSKCVCVSYHYNWKIRPENICEMILTAISNRTKNAMNGASNKKCSRLTNNEENGQNKSPHTNLVHCHMHWNNEK